MVKQRKSKSKGKGKSTQIELLHKDMQKSLEYQRTQEIRFVPEQSDVPRIRFNKSTIYNVELSYSTVQSLSTSGPINTAMAFSLASAANYNSYTTCFDQFRLLQVNVKILPTGIATGSGLNLFTVIDYDDINALGSVSSFFGYSTLKVTPAGQIDERTINPRIAVAAYAGASFSGYANVAGKQWIDSGSAGVQYYGMKYYIPTGSAGQSITFITTMMVQFRSQRA